MNTLAYSAISICDKVIQRLILELDCALSISYVCCCYNLLLMHAEKCFEATFEPECLLEQAQARTLRVDSRGMEKVRKAPPPPMHKSTKPWWRTPSSFFFYGERTMQACRINTGHDQIGGRGRCIPAGNPWPPVSTSN